MSFRKIWKELAADRHTSYEQLVEKLRYHAHTLFDGKRPLTDEDLYLFRLEHDYNLLTWGLKDGAVTNAVAAVERAHPNAFCAAEGEPRVGCTPMDRAALEAQLEALPFSDPALNAQIIGVLEADLGLSRAHIDLWLDTAVTNYRVDLALQAGGDWHEALPSLLELSDALGRQLDRTSVPLSAEELHRLDGIVFQLVDSPLGPRVPVETVVEELERAFPRLLEPTHPRLDYPICLNRARVVAELYQLFGGWEKELWATYYPNLSWDENYFPHLRDDD
jgi:hypothetical protein